MQIPNCKLVNADSDEKLPDNVVRLKTLEDADKVLMSTAFEICEGTPPTAFEGHAELLCLAMSALTGTLLAAGAQAVSSGESPFDVASSTATATRLLARAAAARLVTDVENLVAKRSHQFHSNN